MGTSWVRLVACWKENLKNLVSMLVQVPVPVLLTGTVLSSLPVQ